MPGIEFWALTSDFIGTVLLVIAVLRVHSKLGEEHKIDRKVVISIHKERRIAFLALAFIILGFALQILGGKW